LSAPARTLTDPAANRPATARPVGWRRLGARKPLAIFIAEAEGEGRSSLPRRFGPVSLTLFGVGTIVGVGIFVVTGQIAATHAGPAIVLSFLIAGFACACAALCYAELASMAPIAGGSAYTYAFVTLGELAAWIIAWDVIAEYIFSIAAVASGWSGYVQALFGSLGLRLPPAFAAAPILRGDHGLSLSGALFDAPAALLVLGAGAVVWIGTASVARLTNIIVSIKLSAVVLVIVFGLAHAHPANWRPFIPPETVIGGVSRYGWHGVVAGAGLIFFAYLGFDTITTAGQETRNPQRTLPIAILGSIGICTVLYIGMALAMTGLVRYPALAVPAPIHVAIAAAGPSLAWLNAVVTLSAVIGLASAALALVFGVSRIFFAMARDGLLPVLFTRLSKRSRVPAFGVAVATGAAALLSGLFPIVLLGELISVGTLMAFTVVCGSAVYLRIAQPDAPRTFRAPLWPAVSAIGMGSCLYLLASIGLPGLARIGVWMAIGLAIYFGYSVRSRHGWGR